VSKYRINRLKKKAKGMDPRIKGWGTDPESGWIFPIYPEGVTGKVCYIIPSELVIVYYD